jgi:4-hydroxythreonine-4-phosphate dehydrogenase
LLIRKPKVAITIGDPAGIGPEVTLKALRDFETLPCIPLVICRVEVLQKFYQHLMPSWDVLDFDKVKSSTDIQKPTFINIHVDAPIPQPSCGSQLTGKESLAYIDAAIDLWKLKIINAMVTGPVNKSLVEKWVPFIGHTEYIAQHIHEDNPRMLMYSGKYNVMLVTTHVPVFKLKDVIGYDVLLQTVHICQHSMGRIMKKKPKIAMCGLDPHCGDQGAIGNFDIDVTAKVIKDAQLKGIIIEGPFSADTIFIPQRWEHYDCVIAHYHDQGLIPFKMLAFDEGVNVTVGLSVIRTSVDHGTAFDIAGKYCAGYSSMKKAIELASLLALKEE